MITLAHTPPRRPHAATVAFVVLHGAVALLWWRLGWMAGLPALLLAHAAFLWGTLRYDSALFGPVVRALPTTEPVVWLTIDDGPSADTPAILDLLDRHGARATFFMVGQRAAARPELVREVLRRGHGLGNHSHSHPQAWFWRLGPRRMAAEIGRCQQVLTEIAGTPPRWYRSVVGMTNPFVAAALRRHGLARVGWSARGFDGVNCQPQTVVARIVRDLAPGAIVLLHEGAAHGHNAAIVESVLQQLQVRGLPARLPETP